MINVTSTLIIEGLRLLQEKQAASKLEILRQLIDEGESSGEPVDWDINDIFNTNGIET